MTTPAQALAELERGAVDLISRDELLTRLTESATSSRPLRVKAGFDPTRPDLHLGHVVLMNKLRQFQQLGHHVIFIVGDFTAMVGDPTGRNKARPPLTEEEVQAGAKTYAEQALKVLDPAKTEIRYNSEWLGKLSASEMVKLAAKKTVQRMMDRDDFAERWSSEREIYIHEFLYPLLQGYDSVAIDADIELGGTDQLFNLKVGRDLMERYGKRGQMVLTTPLLEGLDAKVVDGKVQGLKMSKSADNYVGVSESPFDQFRKLMLVNDGVIWRYFELLSAMSSSEIQTLKEEVVDGKHAPRHAQRLFAREIVTRFHSKTDCAEAEYRYDSQKAPNAFPADAKEFTLTGDPAKGGLWIAKALELSGLASSASEGKRQVINKSVTVNGERVGDEKMQLAIGETYEVILGGKNRQFVKIVVK